MLIHRVTRHRGMATATLGAMLIVAAERTPAAQNSQPTATAPPASQSPKPSTTTSTTTSKPVGFFREPAIITSTIDYVSQRFGEGAGQPKNGFYPEFSNMITGSGWISAGPGYRHYFNDDQVLLDTSAALSWHLYKMWQGRAELPTLANDHVTLGAQTMYQDATQVNFYGIGPDSNENDKSQYQLQTVDFVSYASVRPTEWLSIGGELGWLMAPKVSAPGGAFVPNVPTTLLVFPDVPGVVANQPNFAHGEAQIVADTRDHRGYPSSGGVFRAASTSYFDQDGGTFSFRMYEAEAAQFVPLADKRVVLAFRGWTLHSAVPTGNEIPFYLMPAIGGNKTPRDYPDYRFPDKNLPVVNPESRFAIFQHVDGALFVDAGNVAATFGGLNLDKWSYGAGVRLHTSSTTLGRLDVSHGTNGWRAFFRTSDPFRLPRFRRHVAAAPFAP